MLLFAKSFVNEIGTVHQLEYYLRVFPAEKGDVYGVEIRMTDADGRMETEQVSGLCEDRKETERFIGKLAEGLALPVELLALCDDFVSEREMLIS